MPTAVSPCVAIHALRLVAALSAVVLSDSRLGAALTATQRAQLPPASPVHVDFARDIQPILEASCVQCHARGKSKGDFSLETREAFLEGEVVELGKSAESTVVEIISGLDPDLVMPKKGRRLTPAEVSLFRAWIDQGMPWPAEINFHRHEPHNLHPRDLDQLATPRTFRNPVDGWVDRTFKTAGITWPRVVDDRTYARRVWLDVQGLLPPPAELTAFISDRRHDKRERLVQRLLADAQPYAEHWLTFWNDMLRNDYKGTGYIDGGRKQVSGWLYAALARNLPYDQFVRQLVDPNANTEGYTNGITWRGSVNASMVTPMQAAQGVVQVFLGVNLKCASCHDSFISEYTLDDAYGLAGIYANGPLEIAECDKPTGHMSKPKFLYAGLGTIDGEDAATRKRQLADIITGRPNGRLPRTIVNRLWQRLMGHGLVEPVDEMDKPAWSPELLDWLAEDLVAHGFDLKHTLARILTSETYQLPSVDLGETSERFTFRGPGIRRLDAEQFSDALMSLMRIDYPQGDMRINRNGLLPAGRRDTVTLTPRWIWSTPQANLKARPGSVSFTRTVSLATTPDHASLTIAADNNSTVIINGRTAANTNRRDATLAATYDLKPFLKAGSNEIVIKATNLLPDGSNPKEGDPEPSADADSPAGILCYLRIRSLDTIMDVVSDASWSAAEGSTTRAAVELGDVTLSPWKVGPSFMDLASAQPDILPIRRASLLAANPLMTALGRPNREQVVTVRQGTATTLQGLELTNGATLAGLLQQGAAHLLAVSGGSSRALVDSLYLQALGRKPSRAERRLTLDMVGSPATREGLEDLLWSLSMLPEFQLIR